MAACHCLRYTEMVWMEEDGVAAFHCLRYTEMVWMEERWCGCLSLSEVYRDGMDGGEMVWLPVIV